MTGEAKLRIWGCHWKARLNGSVLELTSHGCPEPELRPGDVLKEMEILRERFPRMEYDQAKEAVKYAPMPRSAPVTPRIPGMAQIEREVSLACQETGDELWKAYKCETGAPPVVTVYRPPKLVTEKIDGEWYGTMVGQNEKRPASDHQGRLMVRLGVRFLIRQVYVIGTGVRKWPGSSFDWIYPYAIEAKDRKSDGREATIAWVRSLL